MDDDNQFRRAAFVLPCCCFGLLGIAFLIWLIILSEELHDTKHSLNRLISDCGGVCAAGGPGIAAAGKAHRAANHNNNKGAGVNVFAAKPAKSHDDVIAAPSTAKKSSKPNPGAAVPGGAEVPPRWSRAGAEKKPVAPPKQ